MITGLIVEHTFEQICTIFSILSDAILQVLRDAHFHALDTNRNSSSRHDLDRFKNLAFHVRAESWKNCLLHVVSIRRRSTILSQI